MVLADLRMPDLDGIELLVRIQGRHPSLPVAVLSAHGDIPDAVRATHAGAVDFLTKPIDRERLIKIGRATSELQSLMRISYAVFCLNKKKKPHTKKIA